MWVVLVVGILNREYGLGGLALEKRLEELPSDLSELFKNILRRDKNNLEGFQLCILWILYAKRPLRPQELYHALWIGLSPKDLVDGQILDATVSSVGAGPEKCMITRSAAGYSKGLAETTEATRSSEPIVQFIHESVRDFLIKDRGLYELWPELGLDCEGLGHEKLKQCCNLYANHDLIRKSVTNLPPESDVDRRTEALTECPKEYPFLEYATQHIVFHANAAAKVVPQDEFLSSFAVLDWIEASNAFEKVKKNRYSRNGSLSYILSNKGCPELIRARPKEDPHTQVRGERYDYPLFAGLANGDKDTVAAILDSSSSFYEGISLTEGLNHRKDFKDFKCRTPLIWAAQEGRTGIVKLLLQRGVDINGMDTKWGTPLIWALKCGYETFARFLVERGADVNASVKGGPKPLHLSVQGGHEAMARLLIDKGANVNDSTSSGETILHSSATSGHEKIARLLVDKGADVNARDDERRTPLHNSVFRGHEALARLFMDQGADVNAVNKYGSTPLLNASSEHGHEAIASLLIDKGADVNARNDYGDTPLHTSLKYGHETIASLLIDKGADVNAQNEWGDIPLHTSLNRGHEVIASLLIDKGADFNARNDCGDTSLHTSLIYGHEAIASLLIDKGADVNAVDQDGYTPLHASSEHGFEAIARLLIEKGANVKARHVYGWTPLHLSARRGHETITRLLVDKGADVNARDKERKTPLRPYGISCNKAITRLLLDMGAKIDICDEEGWTFLQQCLKHGNDEIATLLIEKGSFFDVNTSDKDGWTPLQRALNVGKRLGPGVETQGAVLQSRTGAGELAVATVPSSRPAPMMLPPLTVTL
ncbi:hypothetical protein PENANT_c071G03834 [Penicillium antarcticum]|uniref:Uncharacterized protein n=1 Tax=Penicillium antarcticum TaxID=416450 RepID=A0A1V6PQX1_9EURO|nr:hypothetical protein PENANT_c071G03834 [Penicillium antarcticum]